MKHLTINTAITKLQPSENTGGYPAPLLRSCCFKDHSELSISQDSAFREGVGASCKHRQVLAFLFIV